MIEPEDARRIVLGVLEDQALAVGGCVATHHLPDPAVWDLMKTLDAIRRKALAQLEEAAPISEDSSWEGAQPHPAVEEFLKRLRES